MKKLSFEEFCLKLRYDPQKLTLLNEEYKQLTFPQVCSKAKNAFVNYFLSASQYFGHYLKASHSDSVLNSYIFYCSVEGCNMKIAFHEVNNIICLNRKTTNFEHDEQFHRLNKENVRILKSTYKDFFDYSKNGGNVNDFLKNHKELEIINKRKLYDIKTKINKELNTFEELVKRLKNNNYFISTAIKDEDGLLCGCVVINKLIITSKICDILVVDDTVGISKLDYPMECIMCKDGNGKMQLLAFGYLLNKCESGFELFFKTFKELSLKERMKVDDESFGKIFVCDRSKPQSNAIKSVFLNSKIIYCKWHLLKDIERKYSKNSNIYQSCYKMLKFRTEEYEKKYEKYLKELKESNFKTLLINDKDYYIPSIVDKYYHRNILTSNLAESCFSILKRTLNWKKETITVGIETMINISISLINNSLNVKEEIPFVFKNRVNLMIGKVALNHLNNEFKQILSIKPNEKCNCKFNTIKLPCRHWLLKNATEKIDIPEEYLRFDCNMLSLSKNKESDCFVKEIQMEEENMDIQHYVDLLKEKKDSLHFQNDVSYAIMMYLKYGKNRFKRTPRRWNPKPGMTKYSKNCENFRNKLLKEKKSNKKASISRRTICNNFKNSNNLKSNDSNSNSNSNVSNSYSNVSYSNISNSNISNVSNPIISNISNSYSHVSYSNISYSNISNLNKN